jgi:hypothetical protein
MNFETAWPEDLWAIGFMPTSAVKPTIVGTAIFQKYDQPANRPAQQDAIRKTLDERTTCRSSHPDCHRTYVIGWPAENPRATKTA